MKEDGIQYADRESYHHMCRYYSGLFALHPLLEKYNFYWRLEPGGELMLLRSLRIGEY
jgi:mannosyltransferase/alpha 1,2-mannosyltransferase